MREENQTIIKALNMFGRVPETWELLNEVERLNNKLKKIKEIINYYAVENEDYSKIYNDEEKELLEVVEGDK